MNRLLEEISFWLLIIGCFSLLVLLEIAPGWPKTVIGWIVVIIIGIPAYILVQGGGEALLGRIDDSRIGTWVTDKTAETSFSLLRVSFKLAVVLILISFVIIIWLLIGNYLKPVKDFFAIHFACW